MISAEDAVEKGSYALLTADIEDIAPIGVPVYQDVPDDTPPPVIILGDIDAAPLGDKDDIDQLVTLEIVTVTAGDERKPLLGLQGRIKDRLRGAVTEVEGWRLAFTFLDGRAEMTPDASGYVGLQKFEILATRL